jgi:uncharacterized secreted protein with C-terminal beta-propeller domain
VTLLQPTTALYNAKPKVVIDVDLEKVQALSREQATLVGAGDTFHTVYVVDEDGNLRGVFTATGSVELKVGPPW